MRQEARGNRQEAVSKGFFLLPLACGLKQQAAERDFKEIKDEQ
jgi:hypothetical protein